jgi:hypothetical protein
VRQAIAIALLCAAAGCGKKDEGDSGKEKVTTSETTPAPPRADPAPPPAASEASSGIPTSEEQATADKAATVLEDLGKIAEGARGNCDKAAAAMKSVIDKNRSVLSGAAKLGQDEAKEQWLAEKYGPRTDAAKSKLMPLMEKCSEHEGMATVFDSIE